MSEFGEKSIESAERFGEEQRDRAIADIRQSVSLKGDEYCHNCGQRIEVKRRLAMPSAIRCICCQEEFERRRL